MTLAEVRRELSQDQRRTLDYIKANPGATTRVAAIALGRSRNGQLSSLRSLESRGLVRWTWPNRPTTESYSWWPTWEPSDA